MEQGAFLTHRTREDQRNGTIWLEQSDGFLSSPYVLMKKVYSDTRLFRFVVLNYNKYHIFPLGVYSNWEKIFGNVY